MSIFRRNSRPVGSRAEFRVNGTDLYAIDIIQSGATFDLVVRLHPPDRHGKSAPHHHLFPNKHICVSSNRRPKTLTEAKLIAKVWAEGWSQYCRTGRFPGS